MGVGRQGITGVQQQCHGVQEASGQAVAEDPCAAPLCSAPLRALTCLLEASARPSPRGLPPALAAASCRCSSAYSCGALLDISSARR